MSTSASKLEMPPVPSGYPAWLKSSGQTVSAWGRGCSAYTAAKLLPWFERAYRENKSWCHRIGCIAIAGAASTVLPFSWLTVGAAGFSLGTLVGYQAMGGTGRPVLTSVRDLPPLADLAPEGDLAETAVAELVDVFCALIKNNFDLFEMAYDLADYHSGVLIRNLYAKVETCHLPTRARELAMARQALLARHFQTLLRSQATYGDISTIVYRDILRAERGGHFTRLCDVDHVNREELTDAFLSFAGYARQQTGDQKDQKWLMNRDCLAFLLNKATHAWSVFPPKGTGDTREKVTMEPCPLSDEKRVSIQKNIEGWLLQDCVGTRALIKQGRASYSRL